MSPGCFVEASAGTGKTRRLVHEIVSAVADGIGVDRLVAVTFTHAAAGSMKIRLRQELDRRKQAGGTDALQRERLKVALQTLDRAFIGTIHGFCAHLLRQRPVEARIDPDFRELSQPEATRVFEAVFRSWLEKKLATPSPALRRALVRLAWKEERTPEGPVDALRAAAWNLVEWRDYGCAWERREFDRAGSLRALFKRTLELLRLRNHCAHQYDPLFRSMQPVADLVERLELARAAGETDLDWTESEILGLPREVGRYFKKGSGDYADDVTRERVLAAWEEVCAETENFRIQADADLASALREDLWEVVGEYQSAKSRAGQLDFTDLLVFTRDLLRNDWARQDLQRRYDRLYVDEFQDTDPLQAEILLLLCADDSKESRCFYTTPAEGKLFVVGDPKQSIYRFRRADARQYGRIRQHLLGAGLAPDELRTSHRSVEAIQQFVNAAFEAQLPSYLPLSGGDPGPASQAAIVALPIPHVHKGSHLSRKTIGEWSPPTTAAFIEWLIRKSGWTVRDPGKAERVPIAERHICVLFRRFVSYDKDLTQEYVQCLEARGIDHVLVGSKSFHQREEIGTIRTALRAIEWPDDQLSVFAVLRGTLFFIDDLTLLRFREKYRWFSPMLKWDGEIEPEFARVKDALTLLRELHIRRNERPPAGTIRHLLEHVRAHAGFAFHHGGERRLANVYRLSDVARGFELSGPASFRAFVEFLDREHLSGEQSEAPLLEQQAGGVQMMTVHKAKGLEFPVVILADVTTHATRKDGSDRYVNHERQLCAQKLCGWAPWDLLDNREAEKEEDENESVRLAYVAATRARDLLVVTGIGEPGWDGSWLSPLDSALYPALEQRRDSISPGIYRPSSGMHEVLWFDPKLLDLNELNSSALDYEELLNGTAEQREQGIADYRRWRESRDGTIAAGSTPTYRVVRATEAGAVEAASAIELEVVRVRGSGSRPSSRNFGKLVHAILQAGDLADIDRLAQLHGRRWNAPEDDVKAAAEIARAALAHPAIAAANARELFREYPITVTLASGEVVEGVIDLAWTDGKSWTVADYKTGRAEKKYEAQLKLYALAMERATGLPARAVLLEI